MSAPISTSQADFGHYVFIAIVVAFAGYTLAESTKTSAYLAILGADLHLSVIIVQMARFIDFRIARDPRAEPIWRGFPSIKLSLFLVACYLCCFAIGFRTLRASGRPEGSFGENLSVFLTFKADGIPSADYPLWLQILSAVLWMLLAVPILGSRLSDRSKT